MLFMVIEQFRNGDPRPVRERFDRQGRMLPDGVNYVASWIEPGRARCFQLIEAKNVDALGARTACWSDLVDFEIVPVLESSAYWTTLTPWFERRFEFSLPIEALPSVCARLRDTPARLTDALRDRGHSVLIAKPHGKWSAQEHAGHLLDLENLWIARLEDYVAGRDALTPADLTNRVTDDAHYNAHLLEQILEDFRSARGRLVKRATEVDVSFLARTLPHPRLKTPMRLIDHLQFVAEHDDHHLARIRELVNMPK